MTTRRRRLAWGAVAAACVALFFASIPFWLPRLVDDTPLEFQGTNPVAAAWLLLWGASAIACLALGGASLFLPAARAGPRDALSVLLALVAMLPCALMALVFLTFAGADLDH